MLRSATGYGRARGLQSTLNFLKLFGNHLDLRGFRQGKAQQILFKTSQVSRMSEGLHFAYFKGGMSQ